MMNKLDSIWYHEAAPGSNNLAGSHIAVLFCALVKSGMIIEELIEMEFEDVPNTFDDESISPMDYMIAYTDGELFDHYIVKKYQSAIISFFEDGELEELLDGKLVDGLDFRSTESAYRLECNWKNVNTVSAWLRTKYI